MFMHCQALCIRKWTDEGVWSKCSLLAAGTRYINGVPVDVCRRHLNWFLVPYWTQNRPSREYVRHAIKRYQKMMDGDMQCECISINKALNPPHQWVRCGYRATTALRDGRRVCSLHSKSMMIPWDTPVRPSPQIIRHMRTWSTFEHWTDHAIQYYFGPHTPTAMTQAVAVGGF